jgi:hypothetical protein
MMYLDTPFLIQANHPAQLLGSNIEVFTGRVHVRAAALI